MILVDTSVWIEYLRKGDEQLSGLLNANEVSMHPHIIGEIACGNLHNGAEVLKLLQRLPHVSPASDGDVLAFAEHHKLSGRGLGWTDMHLLCAAHNARQPIWTLDVALAKAASDLGLGRGSKSSR
jgi:predicted nucleic acid-binding protein